MNKLFFLLLFIISLIIFSCDLEELEYDNSNLDGITFSVDTVLFDTIFTSKKNVTKRFRVYNNRPNAININKIELEKKKDSPYQIIVNGQKNNDISDIRIIGNDSILVLVEIEMNPLDQDELYLISDQIIFSIQDQLLKLPIVAYGQDVNIIDGIKLECDTRWDSKRPYLISNSLIVEKGYTLYIDEGTKIYNQKDSYFLINGTIKAEGTFERKIIFLNDRLDEEYINAPGQWGGIIFLENSNDNIINNVEIRNSNVGIYLGTPDNNSDPDLIISNSKIENIGSNSLLPTTVNLVESGYGIVAVSSDMLAYNVLINNCQRNVIANFAGGNYEYYHCTFSNSSLNLFRSEPIMFLSNNLVLENSQLLHEELNMTLSNSIVWGNFDEEIYISDAGQAAINFALGANILKTNREELLIQNTITNTITENPLFLNIEEYDYRIDASSPAINQGQYFPNHWFIRVDLDGSFRDNEPDLGAFEWTEN